MSSSCVSSSRLPSIVELDQEARQVVAGFGPSGRDELQQAVEHRGDFGDRLVVLVAAGRGHHRVEEVRRSSCQLSYGRPISRMVRMAGTGLA